MSMTRFADCSVIDCCGIVKMSREPFAKCFVQAPSPGTPASELAGMVQDLRIESEGHAE